MRSIEELAQKIRGGSRKIAPRKDTRRKELPEKRRLRKPALTPIMLKRIAKGAILKKNLADRRIRNRRNRA